MIFLSPLPDGEPCAKAPVPLRFEDVTQDGQLVLEALPSAFTPTIWRGLLRRSEGARAMYAHGIVPVLTRLRVATERGPFSAAGTAEVEAEATYRIARADDGRFMLDMWADLHGVIGRTYGTTEGEGQRALAGRVHAEHVLTRPFAPAGERRVTSLDFPGAPGVAASRPALPPFESIAAVPADASPLEPALRPDATPIVFGLVHTDSNRHVNSLVYLRVFEEAALRRFAELGRASSLLASAVDISYQKPCFAGQAMRVALRAFEEGGRLCVAAVLLTEEDASSAGWLQHARPHVFVRMEFEAPKF